MNINLLEEAHEHIVSDIHYTMTNFQHGALGAADAVFLAGGGQDSAAALLHFVRNIMHVRNERIKGDWPLVKIWPMYIDYGQLVAEVEYDCMIKQCEILQRSHNEDIDIQEPVKFTDPLQDLITKSGTLLNGGSGSAYVEFRNIRYLTMAAGYASLVGARWLIAGLAPAVMSVDSGYAANLATQFALDQNVLNKDKSVQIYAPIILAHRSACVKYLAENGGSTMPSFSCYTPAVEESKYDTTYEPCGTCLSCQVRIGGHRLSGYPDWSERVTVMKEPSKKGK